MLLSDFSNAVDLSEAAREVLVRYDWPGNLREVRAILAEARAACATQCGSCASREIECAVHVSVGRMFEGIERAEDAAAA